MSLKELAATDNDAQKELKAKVLDLERVMMAMPEHQIRIKTTHRFAPGIYTREIFIPKDTTIVGKIQKTEYLSIVSMGCLSVLTEDGMKMLPASTVVRSYPGIKRAAYAHEDTVWITVHQNPTNERDIDKIEEILFAETFDDVPSIERSPTEPDLITWQGISEEKPSEARKSYQPLTLMESNAQSNKEDQPLCLE